MTTKTLKRATMAALLTFAAPALAQSESATADERIDEGNYKYRDITEIEFDGTDVSASLLRPAGAMVIIRRRANFAPLIELRLDFNDEMERSTDLIR